MARKKKDEEETSAATEGQAPDAAADAAEQNASAAGEGDSTIGAIVEAAADAIGSVATAVSEGAAGLVSAITGSGEATTGPKHKRAEKVGVVSSDKMMKTVTVRVDRLVKHPTYRKYVKRRKKFMAHDDLGAKVGDKVKIVETRPLSARKRWRVVEIIQRAEL